MLDKLLDLIKRRGGHRMITRDGKPYLERFYLFKTSWLTIMIHKFWASDPDEPHDHPWNWASLVLRGSYREHGVDGVSTLRHPLSFRIRRAEEFHRIEAFCPGWTTTLFFTGKRRREWGFLRGEKWIPASEYDRQEVEIQGRDFVVEGIFFPKVRYLKARHTHLDAETDCMLPVKTGDPIVKHEPARRFTDEQIIQGLFGVFPVPASSNATDGRFAIEKLIEVVDYVAKLEARVDELEWDKIEEDNWC